MHRWEARSCNGNTTAGFNPKKERKMNNTFHCRPLQTGNKRIPYSVCIFHTSNELGRCFPTLHALPRYHSTHTQN
jgi:hypothetical protein